MIGPTPSPASVRAPRALSAIRRASPLSTSGRHRGWPLRLCPSTPPLGHKLPEPLGIFLIERLFRRRLGIEGPHFVGERANSVPPFLQRDSMQIGRASCRE